MKDEPRDLRTGEEPEEPEGPRDARHAVMLVTLTLAPFAVAYLVWLAVVAF